MQDWVALFDEPLDVDWVNHGAVWLRAFNWQTGLGSMRGVPIQALSDNRLVELDVNTGTDPITVRVTPVDPRGLHVAVRASPGEDLAAVRSAAENAMSALSDARVFAWEAVLGLRGPNNRFSSDATIGPFSLLPGYAFAKTDVGESFAPIHLRGTLNGDSWLTAKPIARRQARLVAGLLTIAWRGDCIRIRREVECAAEGENGMDLEEAEPWAGLISIAEIPDVIHRDVPSWLSASWDRLDDLNVAGAVLAFHEGMELFEEGHPSFAYAAFTACLESIGAITVSLTERCECCHMSMGAGARFRAGVASAPLRDDLVTVLHESYHSYRSPTVHVGTLHGGDDGGASQTDLTNPFTLGERDRFLIALGVLKNHCRDVIQRVLSNPAA